MRVEHLEVENFKGFERLTLDLHPQFTLLVGENGSGKTSILDALAISAAIWLVEPPDSTLANSGRRILPSEIRLEAVKKGDRVQFQERRPVVVRARGTIASRENVVWARQIRASGKATTNVEARVAMDVIKQVYKQDSEGIDVLCPVLAYYGAGRAWLPSKQRIPQPRENGPARRWAAFYDCFSERIRFAELQAWFQRETTELGRRGGQARPGFEVVRGAVLSCIAEATDIWFDVDQNQIALSIDGKAQPFNNLSAGQGMMLALAADLAIKAVTQNAFLLPPDRLSPEHELPRVLKETPGVVLIDELDVHLHPRWQRRVASDLKRTFPSIQFVCTTHSPQVIGEVSREEIRLLQEGEAVIPTRSFGLDSSRVLEELMGAPPRNPQVGESWQKVFALIDQEKLEEARKAVAKLEEQVGEGEPDATRARALMKFLEVDA